MHKRLKTNFYRYIRPEAIPFLNYMHDKFEMTEERGLSYPKDFSLAGAIEMYCLTRLVKSPKVLQLDRIKFDLLQQIKLSLPIEMYTQPFDTIVIEIPEKEAALNAESNEPHKPMFIVVNKSGSAIFTTTMFDSGYAISVCLAGDMSLEEMIQKNFPQFEDSLKTSEEEFEVIRRVLRAALNACMLMDDIGVIELGPSNPKHFNKLLKKGESTNHLPIFYRLKRIIPDRAGPSPHWRRWHYRMQRYGPGLSLVKRILIDSTFVRPRKKKDAYTSPEKEPVDQNRE